VTTNSTGNQPADHRTGPIRLGFIGAGGIVKRSLAPAVHAADGVVLQAAAARDLDRAAALEPAGRSYDDYDALLADPSVDLVYVALDNAGHLPWTLAALAAGKHVLCEKPIGMDPAALEAMIAAAAEHDRLLVEAFWYRWHPRTRRLEQLVAEGAFGAITSVEADFSFDGDFSGSRADNIRLDPERGGGALYDVGCYSASAAVTVLSPARVGSLEVRTTESAWSERGVDLRTTATLASPGGTTVTLGCGISGTSREVIEVQGELLAAEFPGGTAFTNRDQPSSLLLRSTASDGSGTSFEEGFEPVDPYQIMVENVAAAVRGEEAFLVDAEHSFAVAGILDVIRTAFVPPEHA
jgi:predicted dehydrogenase